MGEILFKIFANIFMGSLLLGLIVFIVRLIVAAFRGEFYCDLPWLPWLGGGNYTIKGQITIKEQNENALSHADATDNYDPMKIGLRVAPHTKPQKQKRHRPKPEWWRFLTEESIGSLLEKRRQKNRQKEIDELTKKYERYKI